MSYFRAVILECERSGCDAQHDGDDDVWFQDVWALRRRAAQQGWTHGRLLGDRCPDHSNAHEGGCIL